jgi:hypothetical protein
LKYIDHQKFTAGGRLDVILVDMDKSLVVAELKINEDDDMLMQSVDYYDYVSDHVEAFARLYHDFSIDPVKQIRVILIAPSFSQELVNRCKWLKIPIFLFTFICLKFDGDEGIIPVFTEQEIPVPPPPLDTTTIEDLLNWITDPDVRKNVVSLLEEIKNWMPGQIAIDPVKSGLSMKVRGRVFAYLSPRRQYFIISTYNKDDVWSNYPSSRRRRSRKCKNFDERKNRKPKSMMPKRMWHDHDHFKSALVLIDKQIGFLEGHVSQPTQSISQLALPSSREEARAKTGGSFGGELRGP